MAGKGRLEVTARRNDRVRDRSPLDLAGAPPNEAVLSAPTLKRQKTNV